MVDAISSAVPQDLGPAGAQAQGPRNEPEKILKAAQDFEALLMGQLLKNMRECGSGGWLGTGESDQAGEQAMGVAEEFFARSLAANGGLGLAKMVAQGLSEKPAPAPEKNK